MLKAKIKDRERNQLVNALRTGVVPVFGLHHIQVGRAKEIGEIVKDLDLVSSGGSSVRFISGEFGAGKSFFLTLTKLMAHEKKMVVLNADITTERILCSADGKSRALLTELLKNLSHKSKPEGGGLKSLVEAWIAKFTSVNSKPTENDFHKGLETLSHLTLCSDFSKVLYTYLNAFQEGDLGKIEKCLKWMRAEYETKTEAKADLGVGRIIEDSDFYDVLKLYSGFSILAGFKGMLVCVDELAVLIRLRAPQRSKNYETLLTIINDCLQGSVSNLGFVFGATAEAIQNREKGLFSYGALQTRLSGSTFAREGVRDLTGPVIPLFPLEKEEIYVLLTKLRDIHHNFDDKKSPFPDEGIKAFFNHLYSKMGAEQYLNPRDVIRELLSMLAILDAEPGKDWKDFLSTVTVAQKYDPNADEDLVSLNGN